MRRLQKARTIYETYNVNSIYVLIQMSHAVNILYFGADYFDVDQHTFGKYKTTIYFPNIFSFRNGWGKRALEM